jgi:predicted nucleotidyltransferase component of viral defense system
MALSVRQAVEMFHLVFLRALVAKGEDKSLFALKGGCNLRFYFGSVRYSEDIDLDVTVVSKETLKNKVGKLLQSPLVASPLTSVGLQVLETSTPKQTDTTQRWKIGLRMAGRAELLRTKIEFSRRDAMEGTAFEAVGAEMARPYAVAPFLAMHYTAPRAVAQKIHALMDRGKPQTRDVFDLNHLLARPDTAAVALSDEEKAWIPRAVERVLAFSFDEYAAQVLAYLDPDQREPWDGPETWEAMQLAVVERLGQLA